MSRLSFRHDQPTPFDFRGTRGEDAYTLAKRTSETVRMGAGDDVVIAPGKALDADDRIEGGAGLDDFIITGKMPGVFTFGASTLTGFEFLQIQGRGAYDLVLDSHMVTGGAQFGIFASSIFADKVTGVRIDGSAIDDGTLRLIGSVGDDVLIGGSGADEINSGEGHDTLTGNGGADEFVFNSIIPAHATITDFTQGRDIIWTADFRFDELGITDSPEGAVVEIYDGVFATVRGVAASQLTDADFFFAGHDAIRPDAAPAFTHHAPLIPDLPLA